VRASVYL